MSENKKADPKAIQALKEIYDSLTDEQKEKAKNCKTAEELLKLAGEEGIELPDELLDSVSGGAVYPADNGGWWIINDVANNVQTIVYGSKEEAKFTAKRMGFFRQRTLIKESGKKAGLLKGRDQFSEKLQY